MRFPVIVAAAAFVLAAVVACSPAAAGDSQPQAAVSADSSRPVLAFDKESVELFGVPPHVDALATFLVINKGGAVLRLDPPRLGGEEDHGPELSVGQFEVAPGQAELLTVNLGSHEEPGSHKIPVAVPSNDPQRGSATLWVRFDVGEVRPDAGEGPRLLVDKEIVWTGTVPNDWPLYEQFVLHNDGDDLLVIEANPEVRIEAGC